jgi:4-hydroxy-tetrahydrodipicolinate reductase
VTALIVGATGFSEEDERRLLGLSAWCALVRSGNFSLGVTLLVALVEQAAQRLGSDWDIEIAETHHRRKVDAPSGTARMLAEAAAAGRGGPLADLAAPAWQATAGPRPEGAIGMAVSRAGGVVGDHAVAFASEDEVLTLSHRALDRTIFARGALAAAAWAHGRPPGLYGMRDVLEL